MQGLSDQALIDENRIRCELSCTTETAPARPIRKAPNQRRLHKCRNPLAREGSHRRTATSPRQLKHAFRSKGALQTVSQSAPTGVFLKENLRLRPESVAAEAYEFFPWHPPLRTTQTSFLLPTAFSPTLPRQYRKRRITPDLPYCRTPRLTL